MQDEVVVSGGVPDEPAVNGEVVDRAFAGPGRWLAVPLAALHLGLSERTLWRRINAGKLRQRAEDGRTLVYVPLSGAVPDGAAPLAGTAPDGGGALAPLSGAVPDGGLAVAIVEELRRQHEEATEQLARKDVLLADLQYRLGRTEAERDALRAATERPRRPWWQVWQVWQARRLTGTGAGTRRGNDHASGSLNQQPDPMARESPGCNNETTSSSAAASLVTTAWGR